jgi:hypothetical protein
LAEDLPQSAWRPLPHRLPPPRTSHPRRRPEDVKSRIVFEREFQNLRPVSEEVAEFEYSPTACRKSYRIVVIRKNLSVERGDAVLFEEIRYFFFITNDRERRAAEIVGVAHERCDQENLIAQLKGGVRALVAPLDTLESNWAYMVMAGLAWSLKAWWALQLPERPGRWADQHRLEKRTVLRMDFKTFVNSLVRMPCQIIRSGRRIIYRLLGWNPWQHVFFRVLDVLRC